MHTNKKQHKTKNKHTGELNANQHFLPANLCLMYIDDKKVGFHQSVSFKIDFIQPRHTNSVYTIVSVGCTTRT